MKFDPKAGNTGASFHAEIQTQRRAELVRQVAEKSIPGGCCTKLPGRASSNFWLGRFVCNFVL